MNGKGKIKLEGKMKNEIETVRQDINLYFDKNNRLGIDEHYELSESGLYYYTSERYRQTDPKRNWIVCKIEIWDIEKSVKIFEYLTNSDDMDYCSCWVHKNGKEYLMLPEAFQGQSVFDVSSKQLFSFYSREDPFIWQSIHPSPNGNKVAVDGCYWACPNELRVYNTENITELPYKMIFQDTDFTNERGCVFEYWEDNETIVVCENKKEIRKIKI